MVTRLRQFVRGPHTKWLYTSKPTVDPKVTPMRDHVLIFAVNEGPDG